MQKLLLLDKIQKLSAIIHNDEISKNILTAESISEIRSALDKLTEEYIAAYC